MSNFYLVLKSLRTSFGMTQNQLADRLNISRSAIGMYEKGTREPDYETLESIADIFNVDIDYLLGRTYKTTMLPEHLSQNAKDASLLETFHSLNDTGKDKVIDYAQDLSQNPSYSAKPLYETADPYRIHTIAAHERPGATEEDKQSDYDLIRQIAKNHGGGGAKRE